MTRTRLSALDLLPRTPCVRACVCRALGLAGWPAAAGTLAKMVPSPASPSPHLLPVFLGQTCRPGSSDRLAFTGLTS